jgi:predicted permease
VLLLATLVLTIPFANVAILVYARTATRAGEMAVRSAMGATRSRVVTLLFVEALALSALSAVAGVWFAFYSIDKLEGVRTLEFGGDPFWARSGRDPMTLLYVVGLTVLAAVVAGVLPGLKATGRSVRVGLSREGAGNGMRLGGGWTALIVLQVALAVTVLPSAVSSAWHAIGYGAVRPAFDPDGLLAVTIRAGGPVAGSVMQESPDVIAELVRRVSADPGVSGVALTDVLPGMMFDPVGRIEVEGIVPPRDSLHVAVKPVTVSQSWFETLGVPVTSGRDFRRADLEAEVPPVIVDRNFERWVLKGGNAIGRYVRWAQEDDAQPEPWHEIVGVVGPLTESSVGSDRNVPGVIAQMFLPLPSDAKLSNANLVIRTTSPTETATRVRILAALVDPTLRVESAQPMDDLEDPMRTLLQTVALTVGLAVLAVVMLSCAGIYALTSFTVTQRRREIGVRSALGANPRRLILSVLSQVTKQLGVGALLGFLGAIVLDRALMDWVSPPLGPLGLALVILLTIAVALAAAWGPARRGLRIGPMEVIKEG